jgi:hypothetical protein
MGMHMHGYFVKDSPGTTVTNSCTAVHMPLKAVASTSCIARRIFACSAALHCRPRRTPQAPSIHRAAISIGESKGASPRRIADSLCLGRLRCSCDAKCKGYRTSHYSPATNIYPSYQSATFIQGLTVTILHCYMKSHCPVSCTSACVLLLDTVSRTHYRSFIPSLTWENVGLAHLPQILEFFVHFCPHEQRLVMRSPIGACRATSTA